uniref:Uncharacterized protein n=1 Tax=mine drainage metagenome TaxID=410659 RepID=E6QMS5_9ZZZZ
MEHFGCGEALEKRETFGHDADLALDLERVLGEIEAEDLDGPVGGLKQAGEHADAGGFASTVGAEKAEELALIDAQIDALDGDKRAEAAGEAVGFNSQCSCALIHVCFEHGCYEDTARLVADEEGAIAIDCLRRI